MPHAQGVGTSGRHHRNGRRGRRRMALFLAGVVLVGLVLPGLLYRVYGLAVSVPARFGVLEVAGQGRALAVRREEVIPAVQGGRVYREAGEGERVARGRLVARIVSGTDQATMARQVDKVERQLHEVQKRAVLNRAAEAATIAVRANQLDAERQRLANLARSVSQDVLAGVAGTVSYTFDGMEGVLREEDFALLLDPETDLSAVARRAKLARVEDGAEVASGTPVVKIIDNFHFWLVIELPTTKLPVTTGERVRVRVWSKEVPGDATSPGTVVATRETGPGQRLVVSLEEYWPWFNTLRWAEAEVIKDRYEGAIIPTQAIARRGSRVGVWVQLPRGRVFQTVVIRGGRGDEVVVDGIAAGTRVRRRVGTRMRSQTADPR